MKLVNNKFKKVVVPFAVAGSLTLSSCGTTNVNVVEDKNFLQKYSQESSFEITETPTNETTEVKVEEINEEIKDFYAEAAKSYNDNTYFYAETGMAYKDENADQGINIDRIENAIKVINGEVSDLTPSQVMDAKEDINYILLPQNLVTNLDNVTAEELGYVTIEGSFNMSDVPSLDEYAQNKETREFVEEYEELRDKVIEELNTTNKVSAETKNELKEAVIKMEEEYLPDENNMNTDVTAEGNKLLENLAKESLTELTAHATNEARIQTDKFPGGLKLILETDEERDIQSKALIHGVEVLTDEEKGIYAKSTAETVVNKYETGACEHAQNLADHAKGNSNVHSQIEDLKKYKDYLISQKIDTFEYKLSI